MNRLRDVFRRIGTPDAVSWPAFWVTLVANAIVTFFGGYDVDANFLQRAAVLALSQAGMFAVLVAFRKRVLDRNRAGQSRPWATLIAFTAAGILRGLIAGGFLLVFAGATLEAFRFRTLSGVGFTVIILTIVAIAVAATRDYKRERVRLLQSRATLAAAREQLVLRSDQRTAEVVSRIEGAINEALTASNPEDRLIELERLGAEVVRPLSHELALDGITWNPPRVEAARVRFAAIMDRWLSATPFAPLMIAIASTVLIATLSWDRLDGMSPLWLSLVGATSWVALTVGNRLFSASRQSPMAFRAVLVIAILIGIGAGVGGLVDLTLGPFQRANLILLGIVMYCVLGVPFGLARAANAELTSTVKDLKLAEAELTWQLKRLHIEEWCRQRQLARALHGPVQSTLAATVSRLRTDSTTDLESLRADLKAILISSSSGATATWSDGLARIASTWRGLCAIAVDESAIGDLAIDEDPLCAEIALEIVAEAVSNAVRHGRATTATTTVVVLADSVRIEVGDNGVGTLHESSGLGTRLLNDCALTWNRSSTATGMRLTAVLPFAAGRVTESSTTS